MNENARKWVEALESGEFHQGRSYLRTGDRFCCLGVACEVYRRETGKGHWMEDRWIESNHTEGTHLPETVRAWLGMRSNHGNIKGRECLIDLNDRWPTQSTFKEIAAVIRDEPEGLFW